MSYGLIGPYRDGCRVYESHYFRIITKRIVIDPPMAKIGITCPFKSNYCLLKVLSSFMLMQTMSLHLGSPENQKGTSVTGETQCLPGPEAQRLCFPLLCFPHMYPNSPQLYLPHTQKIWLLLIFPQKQCFEFRCTANCFSKQVVCPSKTLG